jgi:hypothetical protein
MTVRLVEENGDLELGIYRVTGEIDLQVFLDYRRERIGLPVFRNLIVDFTEADISGLATEEVKDLIADGVTSLRNRDGGITVLVSRSETNWLLLKYYCELADIHSNLPVTFCFVRDMGAAREAVARHCTGQSDRTGGK